MLLLQPYRGSALDAHKLKFVGHCSLAEMIDESTNHSLKRIVLAHMNTVLKPAGFRKTQTTFAAEQDEAVMFIQLQSSMKSTKDLLVATVNLGIFSKKLAEVIGNTHKPNLLESQWQELIGWFMPQPFDKWWEMRTEEEAHLCGREINAILSSGILPEMKSLASTENLKSLWKSGRSPGLTEYQRNQFLRALE